MTHIQTDGSAAQLRSSAFRPFHAIAERLQGPGGFYNAGNLLGLSVALATQFAIAAASPTGSVADHLYAYFAGSPQAVALTVATAIFLVSGETYHRAWAGRAVPSVRLNRIADVLSAAGAMALTISLIFTGQALLAAASGVLTVGGKLGSAVTCDDCSRLRVWPAHWRDPFRMVVLLGRAPGLIAAAIDLTSHLLGRAAATDLWSLLPSATLVVCYGLWIRADLMLLGVATHRAPRNAVRGAS